MYFFTGIAVIINRINQSIHLPTSFFSSSRYIRKVTMAIKEVVQTLVSENRICSEKIGTSNYFWSFPATIAIQKREENAKLRSQLDEVVTQCEQLDKTIQRLKEERVDTDQRKTLLSKYKEYSALHKKLEQQNKSMSDRDPRVIKQKEQYAQGAIESANRWTDNIQCTLTFISRLTHSTVEVDPQYLEYIEM
eukprot:CFRG8659